MSDEKLSKTQMKRIEAQSAAPTLETDASIVSAEYIRREMDYYTHKFILADIARKLERERDEARAERDAIKRECDSAHVDCRQQFIIAMANKAEAEKQYQRAEQAESELAAAKEQLNQLVDDAERLSGLSVSQMNHADSIREIIKELSEQLAAERKRAESLVDVIEKCQLLLAKWIVPDSGITDHSVLNSLLGILDNQQTIRLMKNETVKAP